MNTWSGFHNDMEKTKSILPKNLFLPRFIDKVVKDYLSNQYNSKESLDKKGGNYFKLSFAEFFSRQAHNKTKEINKKLYRNEVTANLVFVPFKIDSIFLIKDKLSSFLKPMALFRANLILQAVILVSLVTLSVIYLLG